MRKLVQSFLRLVLLVVGALAEPSLFSAEWFVATNGTPRGAGTPQSPWDIVSALAGRQKAGSGDTLWLRGGVYRHPFKNGGMGYEVKLAGKVGAPVQVRAAAGARVTIDGGLNVLEPSTHLWVRDVEILVSDPRPERPVPPDGTYRNLNRPWGGLNVYGGAGCKFIDLIIHDNSQGVSWWKGSTDSELYGCLIYDNGWAGTNRGHGHAIYTQNRDGVKTISDCILTGGYGYTMHAYGSEQAWVDNYLVEGNIAYAGGTFLVGGGRASRGLRVFTNALHGLNLQLGYTAPQNEDCEVRGNVVIEADLTISAFKSVLNEGNLVVARGRPRPPGVRVILRPNKYDPARAHLAIYNFQKSPFVDVDASAFLKPGDAFRLMNPRDFFGRPLLTGTAGAQPIHVPMNGEFAAFVLTKGPG